MCDFKETCLCRADSGSAFTLPEGTYSISYALWGISMKRRKPATGTKDQEWNYVRIMWKSFSTEVILAGTAWEEKTLLSLRM